MKKNYFLLLCVSLLIGFSSFGQSIIRGPYLQKGTTNSVVVRWRTDSNVSSIVEYSTNTSYSSTFSDSSPKTEHELEITGLEPNTKYFYRIGNNGSLLGGSTDLYFKTHPDIGTSGNYRFWVLGDCGTADGNAMNVRDAYYNYSGSSNTDGILFLGDNAYLDGTDPQYQAAVFDMYPDKLKNTIAWSCFGNHEGWWTLSNPENYPLSPYFDIFTFPVAGESGGLGSGTEAYYSFDYGNIHFIVLDSFATDRSVGEGMYTWAENDIQNTTQKWIVAFWHHPPYSKGSHDSDNGGNNTSGSDVELIQMRENFLPMLEANGVDLVLAGHSHSYERSYLLNGHYGLSNTFNSVSHTVGDTGDGDGKVGSGGAYEKSNLGSDAGKGAVYVVTGSAGKTSSMEPIPHQAMYYSVEELGSSVLEVDGNILTLKFLNNTGAIEDQFTIEKSGDSHNNGCADVNITINFDIYPEETSWNITDTNGSIVASGGPYESQPDSSTVNITECLPAACYNFTILDSYGDGLLNSSGTNGSYTFTVDGEVIASGGDFNFSETTPFCISNGGDPTCNDGLMNGDETGIDCGGPDCPDCPTCDDGVMNGEETGVDCGGPDCAECPPTCDDGILNGNETGVDCGGSDCVPCPTCIDVNITINFDIYPEETSWNITDTNGSIVASGGPYESQPDSSTVNIIECLPAACYNFTILDSYGDGLLNSSGINGSYTFTVDGEVIASGGDFNFSETTPFCISNGGDPTCNDGLMNGDETGIDCGGPDCPDCPTCDDGVMNGEETGVDCGGPDCAECPPTCDDGILNGNETGVDCGGPDCVPCPTCIDVNITINFDIYPEETSWNITDTNGSIVASGGPYESQPDSSTVNITECLPAACYNFTILDSYGDGLLNSSGINGSYTFTVDGEVIASGGDFNFSETTPFCISNGGDPTCNDGLMNGDETGIDCGGPDCPDCPTCDDGVMNGEETGVDCGGPDCAECPPTCDDGILNGNETGVDCGGPDCAPCPTCIDVNITINFDIYPEETSWNITDTNGSIVASGGPYESQPDSSTVNITECLPAACYNFTILDSYGDGLFNTSGTNGSYTFTVDGEVIASGGDFNFSETTPFCISGGSSTVQSRVKLSVSEKDRFVDFRIYPIPTQALLYVEIDKKSDYLLIDMLGRTIINSSLNPGKNEIQLRDYEAGVYFLRITNEKNIITKRIVIE